MNASRAGIEMEKSTARWVEILSPFIGPTIAVVAALWVAKAVFEEKFVNLEQRVTAGEVAREKQDDRISAIYQALADIRTGVAEIKGRLQIGESPK